MSQENRRGTRPTRARLLFMQSPSSCELHCGDAVRLPHSIDTPTGFSDTPSFCLSRWVSCSDVQFSAAAPAIAWTCVALL